MDFLDWLTDVMDLIYEKDDEKNYGSVSEDDLEEIANDLINGKKEHDKKCCDEKNCHCDKKDDEEKNSPAEVLRLGKRTMTTTKRITARSLSWVGFVPSAVRQ